MLCPLLLASIAVGRRFDVSLDRLSNPNDIHVIEPDRVEDVGRNFSVNDEHVESALELKFASSIDLGEWGAKHTIGVIVAALCVFAMVFILPIREKDHELTAQEDANADFDALYGKWRMTVGDDQPTQNRIQRLSRLSITGASDSVIGGIPRDATPSAVREAFEKSYSGDLGWRYCLLIALMVIHAITCLSEEHFYESDAGSRVPAISVVMMTNLVSFCVSLAAGIAIEGFTKVQEAVTYRNFGRWALIGILFVFAEVFSDASMKHNNPNAEAFRHVLSLVYLPICAWLSKVAFSRKYSALDWLSLGVLSFSCMTFVLMRERSRAGFPTLRGIASFASTESIVTAVIVGVAASILSEQILKGRQTSQEGRATNVQGSKESFILNKIHLDCAMMLLSLMLCLNRYDDTANPTPLFADWNVHAWAVVGGNVIHKWLAMLTVQTFSSVSKSLVQSLAMVIAFYVEDVVLAKHSINQGYIFVASSFVLAITCTAAYIFQAGRAYDRVIGLIEARASRGSGSSLHERTTFRERLSAWSDDLSKYSSVILYVLMSIVRAVFQAMVIGDSMITPGSMAVAFNIVGCIIFNIKIFLMPREGSTGWQDFQDAWNVRKVIKFLPVGFFFAVAAVVTTSAFAMEISPSLFNFIGNIWLPCAALLGRYILRKFYSELEWGVILMLTMATAAFGYMKSDGISGDTAVAPMALVFAVAAPVASALSSLLSELLLKAETEPISIQKIRFDFGSLVFAVVLLPVQALLSMYSGDPNLARFSFWSYRPLTKECHLAGHCVDNTAVFRAFNTSMASDFSDCACGRGVFVCWDGHMIIVLCVNIVHSILIVKIVKNFSSVHRALGDAFMLMALYLLDPFVQSHSKKGVPFVPLDDWALNFTAMIIPLTALLFNQCANQLHRVSSAMQSIAGPESQAHGAQQEALRSQAQVGKLETTRSNANEEPLLPQQEAQQK